MEKLSFFIPVRFDKEPKTLSQSLLEIADYYFYLGGKQALAISNDSVKLESKELSPCWLTALKILSYFTLVIPIGMLITKLCLRSAYPFYIAPEPEPPQEETVYRMRSHPPKVHRMSDRQLLRLEKKAHALLKVNRLLVRMHARHNEKLGIASLLSALQARYGTPTIQELVRQKATS